MDPTPAAAFPPRPRIGLGIPRSRGSRGSAVLAFLLHVALLALIVRVAPSRNLDFQASDGDGSGSSTGGGGGGGGRVRIVALPALSSPTPVTPTPVPVAPPKPVVKPEVAVPVPEPVVEETVVAPPAPDSLPTLAVAPAASSTSGEGTGAGTGKGTGTGTGTGSGSGSGNGSGIGSGNGPGTGGGGGKARPPEPRQLILPPADVPKSLRGATIAVTFMVGPEGRVEDVRLAPDPSDRGFARKLEEVMRSYRFRPARGPDGLPVAGIITVELTF